jgi:hypothetical protein
VGQALHLTRMITSSARTALTAKFSPRGCRPSTSWMRALPASCAGTWAAARCGSSNLCRQAHREQPCHQLPALRRAGRDLWQATGFNKGLGGSMHAFFPPFRRHAQQRHRRRLGRHRRGRRRSSSASTEARHRHRQHRRRLHGLRPVWEAMMFAAMDQYRTLWPKEAGGAPPISSTS